MTRAEAIMQALLVGLTVPPLSSVPAACVFRDEEMAIEQAVLPAIVLNEGDEPAPDLINFYENERYLDISMIVLAKGAVPFSAADAAFIEAHTRIMATRQLGGLSEDITEGATRRERADLNTRLARVEKTYRIKYRTAEGDLA